MRWRFVDSKIKNNSIDIETETGHIIHAKISPDIQMDLDNDVNGLPFFFLRLSAEYQGVSKGKNAKSLESIRKSFRTRSILNKNSNFEHIQVGFVYASEENPNNHKWMINFIDKNNNITDSLYGVNIEMRCPFTTISWQDGVWHGRFIIYKKDIDIIHQPEEKKFILIGKNKLKRVVRGNVIKKKHDRVSIRFNKIENLWYCEAFRKSKLVDSISCRSIKCDTPLIGRVDYDHERPKVTADIKKNDIKGMVMELNELIIKSK